MDRYMFIDILRENLEKNKVTEIDDIIFEYEEHYNYKLEDGYSEEEISKKLGDPLFLATQYIENTNKEQPNKKFINITGIISLDIFVLLFFITFYAWIAVLFVFSTASLSIGLSLFLNLSPYNLIPYLPYWNGAVLSISFISLALLSYIGTYYNYLYLKQLLKSYFRFHNNVFAKTKNNPTLPSLPIHPKLSKKTSRKLRSIVLFSLNVFAISFILGYLVITITAKSFEFWHVYNWFI